MKKGLSLNGSSIYIESLDTVYDQVVSMSLSYGKGGLEKDTDIIFPVTMVRDMVTKALYEVLMTGAVYPGTGIITLLTGDASYNEEFKEIIYLVGEEFGIHFIIEEKLTPGLPTLCHLTFISKVEKNLLKKRDIKENMYVYYMTTSEEVIPVDMMMAITSQEGFAGFYLLKDESIDKGLQTVFEATPYFLIPEPKGFPSFKEEVKVGKGLLAFSPYHLKDGGGELLIDKLGIIFKKGLL